MADTPPVDILPFLHDLASRAAAFQDLDEEDTGYTEGALDMILTVLGRSDDVRARLEGIIEDNDNDDPDE